MEQTPLIWISPSGAVGTGAGPDRTSGRRLEEGWIGLTRIDGTISVSVREGAVDARAARALNDMYKGEDPDSPVRCTRGDGTLRSVRREIQRTCWHGETYRTPEEELDSIRRGLAVHALDASHGAWLRAGLASGEAPDPDRVRAAAATVRDAARAVLGEAGRTLRDIVAGIGPEEADRAALAWLDRIDVLQRSLEASWVGLAGAACASEGEPDAPVVPTEDGTETLLAIRRLRTLRAGMARNSLLDLRMAFPDAGPVLDALDGLRICTRLPLSHLATARGLAASGLGSVALAEALSFRVCHEACRSYQAVEWRVRDVLKHAAAAPPAPSPAP